MGAGQVLALLVSVQVIEKPLVLLDPVFLTFLESLQGGSVAGNGTITASVTNSGGTLTPGTSPGSITIDGNYVQTDGTPPSGEFSVEIGGLTPVTQYDQVTITGANHSATLAGTLVTYPAKVRSLFKIAVPFVLTLTVPTFVR